MSTNATTSPQSPLPLKRVDFYGLTFTSADQAIAAIMNDTISIQALANSDVTAYFVDCHWKGMTNRMAIHNSANDRNVMAVVLQQCSFTDTDSSSTLNGGNASFPMTIGIVSSNGFISMEDCAVTNYNVSRFLDISGGANMTMTSTTIIGNTLKDPEGFQDFVLLYNGSIFIKNAIVQENVFSNFLWVQSGGTAQVTGSQLSQNFPGGVLGALVRMTATGASVTLTDTFLSGRSFALVTVSGLGGTLFMDKCILESEQSTHAVYSLSDTTISNSCFRGRTTFPPIFITGDIGLLTYDNVFENVTVRDSNCTGIFVENEGSSCFYPSNSSGCDGQCLPTDATVCSVDEQQLPGIPTCSVDCSASSNNGTTGCSESLLDLRCAMCAEAKANINGVPFRDAPFIYQLCENTMYEVLDETRDTIYPILNDTIIVCGADGAVSNNCTIVGGFLQVEISDKSRDNTFLISPVPLTYVAFGGITFRKVKVDSRMKLSTSVWAHGGPDVTAEFISCLWTEIGGTFAILNQNPTDYENLDGSTEPAMTVRIVSSEFRSNQEGNRHLGIQTTYGRIFLKKVAIVDYSTVKQTIGVFNKAVMRITNSRIENNTMVFENDQAKPFISVETDSTLQVTNSLFKGITPCLSSSCLILPTGVIVAVESQVQVTGTIFEDIVAQVTISVNQSDLSITDSCFIGGNQLYPVFVDSSIEQSNQNYGESLVTSCPGIFVVNGGGQCLDSSNNCLGDCTLFNNTVCGATMVPPVTSFQPTTSPMPAPSVSMAPSNEGETLTPTVSGKSTPMPVLLTPTSSAFGLDRPSAFLLIWLFSLTCSFLV